MVFLYNGYVIIIIIKFKLKEKGKEYGYIHKKVRNK